MAALVDIWPLAGLVVRTPRVVLRWPGDEDLAALAEVAVGGVHPEDEMPFVTPWTRGPAEEVRLRAIQYHWLSHGQWSPEHWSWDPVVVVDGEIVGSQGCGATDFAVRRTVSTGSWLGLVHHGRGIGTEMRRAMLHFVFEGLGAQRAETGAFEETTGSLGVTRRMGYRPNGDRVHTVEGRLRREVRFVMTAEDWASNGADTSDVEIDGLEPCLSMFGAVPSDREGQKASGRPSR